MSVVHLAPAGAKPSVCCGRTREQLGNEPVTFDVSKATCGTYGTAYARMVNEEWDRAEATELDQ